MKTIELKVTPSMLRESHRRQFNGEDWQAVAVDIWGGIPDSTEDDFNYLSTSPDPGCECGFCATAAWQD